MKKKIITTPFDRYMKPPKQNLFFMPIIWLYCWWVTKKAKLKINKVGMKGLKPPFLVLGSHHAFMDFFVTPLALFPYRANYISELEGFEAYGEWLYRQVGCLGTRKFVNDLALIKNIQRVIKRNGILVLYPEARYANVGTNSKLPESVGKLAKMLKVPVVVINMLGNYLQSPIWNLTMRKEVKLEATITQVFTREELGKATISEINEKLQEFLTYDEYSWQYETKQAITYEKRAEGLELVLYQCPVCKYEFKMASEGAELFCRQCGERWYMTEYGRMEHLSKNKQTKRLNDEMADTLDFAHIPNWYEWERKQVINEIDKGTYFLNIKVHIESLPNAVNFIDLGEGGLLHDKTGFYLTLKDYGEDEEKTLHFLPITMTSIHTEYNYRGKGQCVTLSTLDNTYFLFPRGEGFNATKIQFATEYLYEVDKGKKHKNYEYHYD
jgi:DNA-directed RNA polymerase subunit RPC12/RpoP